MNLAMPDNNDSDITRGEMILSVATLYWSLHERLDGGCPELSKLERMFLVKLSKPLRIGDMAKNLQVLPSTLTALADDLEKRGFIERHRDPDDRRAWLLELTKLGHKTRAELLDRVETAVREATGLPEEDLKIFGELLLRVRNHIMAEGRPKGLPF